MEPDYHVPANRSPSPYRWRMIIRIVLALVGGCMPMVMIVQIQLRFYINDIAVEAIISYYYDRPTLWAVFPLLLALLCSLIGIGRDGWLLAKRRGTPTLLPWPYRFAMLFAAIAVVLYVRTLRIP